MEPARQDRADILRHSSVWEAIQTLSTVFNWSVQEIEPSYQSQGRSAHCTSCEVAAQPTLVPGEKFIPPWIQETFGPIAILRFNDLLLADQVQGGNREWQSMQRVTLSSFEPHTYSCACMSVCGCFVFFYVIHLPLHLRYSDLSCMWCTL